MIASQNNMRYLNLFPGKVARKITPEKKLPSPSSGFTVAQQLFKGFAINTDQDMNSNGVILLNDRAIAL